MALDNITISRKGKELNKAAKENASPSILLTLLKELRSGVVATEASLRATSIGAIVNGLRKHSNDEVKELAGKIVTQWRDAVQKDKVRNGAGSASSQGKSGGGSGSATASPVASNAKVEENGSGSGNKSSTAADTGPPKGVDPANRTHKTDKIDIKPTGNTTRDSCVGLLYNGLVYMSTLPPSKVLDVATAVEQQIHAKFGPEEKPDYKSKVRSLFQNLKSKTNTSLRVNVLNGKISPQRFVTMSDDDLKSAELKEEEKRLEDENMRVAQVSEEVPSVTDTLTCPKCHQRSVSFYQAQTRSADEPMTTFCTCIPCGHKWRFS